MTAEALYWCSFSILLLVVSCVVLMSLPRRCPRCGKRHWIHAPHVGQYVVYCAHCALFVDSVSGKDVRR